MEAHMAEATPTRTTITVDGVTYPDDVEPRMLLVQYLRDVLGKTGTLIGCDTTNCGACTVHLDGRSVKSCTMFAVQADGSDVTTVEGLSYDGELHPMQEAFHQCHALQCGYCKIGRASCRERVKQSSMAVMYNNNMIENS